MLFYLTLIFACQLAGEFLVSITALPIPGPVCGMAILFFGLALRGAIPEELGRVSQALVDNLSLMFIPAGAGVLLHARLLERDWLALSVALVVSTLLTIGVTALIMSRLAPLAQNDETAEQRS